MRSVRKPWPDVTEMDGFFLTPTMDTDGGQWAQSGAQTTGCAWDEVAGLRSGQEHGSERGVVCSAIAICP